MQRGEGGLITPLDVIQDDDQRLIFGSQKQCLAQGFIKDGKVDPWV